MIKFKAVQFISPTEYYCYYNVCLPEALELVKNRSKYTLTDKGFVWVTDTKKPPLIAANDFKMSITCTY